MRPGPESQPRVRGTEIAATDTPQRYRQKLAREFVVTLPLVRAAISPGPGSRKAESDRRRLRILVADDNRDSTDGCAMLLQMSGHDVRTAYSGTEALAVAVEFIPQIALLDIGMPGMNGYADR